MTQSCAGCSSKCLGLTVSFWGLCIVSDVRLSGSFSPLSTSVNRISYVVDVECPIKRGGGMFVRFEINLPRFD